jgi:hypothetical protein
LELSLELTLYMLISRKTATIIFPLYTILFFILFCGGIFFPSMTKGCYDFRCDWVKSDHGNCYQVVINNTMTNCVQCFHLDVDYPMNSSYNCFNMYGNDIFDMNNSKTCPRISTCSNRLRFLIIESYEIIILILFVLTLPLMCCLSLRVREYEPEEFERIYYVN